MGSWKIIEAAARCASAFGASALKFQSFSSKEFVANLNAKYEYEDALGNTITVKQSELFEEVEFPLDWHNPAKNICKSNGIDFLSSAADIDFALKLIELKVPFIKLSSEDLINIRLIEQLADTQYPICLSTGMANDFEIENAIQILSSQYTLEKISLMHCVSVYPTPYAHANVSRIGQLKKRFGLTVGYSDHTVGWKSAILALAKGATFFEKHFTLSRFLPGPDHAMSEDPEALKNYIHELVCAHKALGEGDLDHNEFEDVARANFRRSIVAKRNLKQGEIIDEDAIAFRRAGGHGLNPLQKKLVLGKMVNNTILENCVIERSDIS